MKQCSKTTWVLLCGMVPEDDVTKLLLVKHGAHMVIFWGPNIFNAQKFPEGRSRFSLGVISISWQKDGLYRSCLSKSEEEMFEVYPYLITENHVYQIFSLLGFLNKEGHPMKSVPQQKQEVRLLHICAFQLHLNVIAWDTKEGGNQELGGVGETENENV